MSYKRTLRGVDFLIENELDFASEEHGATFASLHEGAAVLCEEVDEVALEYHDMARNYNMLWSSVKEDDEKTARERAEDIASFAERLACEAIQVAAMALKFVDTVEEGEDADTCD